MRVGLSSTVITFNDTELRVSSLDRQTHIRISLTKIEFGKEIKHFLENYGKTFQTEFKWIIQSKHSITHLFESKKEAEQIKLTQIRTSKETYQQNELHLSIRDLKTLKTLILKEKLSNTAVARTQAKPKRAWRPRKTI